ncbi:MAG TPA: site-specific integrase [Parapedobacter sp.]|uniref:tyrosine-type recombinase/integrase n=1 Tax=Parapedobacter sp. TaxID=1958893 RepID=UPI002BD9CD1B|nr:site-specific integrase [Parapedobacter sp.]HWK58750.1 site-specific integrase [Parapedobacter sp.]
MSFYQQKISVKIRMRARANAKNGTVFVQLIIDGESKRYPLGITWPKHLFDKEGEKLLPRQKDDTLCYQHNLVLQNELAKWNRLILRYYVAEHSASHDDFKRALKLFNSREDVIGYFRVIASLLGAEKVLDGETIKRHETMFRRTEKYFKEKGTRWQFNTVQPIDMLNIEAWIRERLSHNTTCAHMRVLHKYFGIAADDGVIIHDPMSSYKMPAFHDGVRDALEIDEIKQLKNYYDEGDLTEFEADILRRYLICCYTGLRKSDIEQLDPRFHIRNGNVLRLHMFKTRRYGKVVEFTMSKTATALIGKKRARLFPFVESGLLCKTLRRIAERAGIDKYLKFHSGRDSFATAYLELGGNIKDLQEILGHSSIKYTEIYLKMTSRTKSNIMSKFDAI